MRSLLLLFSFALVTAACAPTTASFDSGIEGQVTIGPLCPVMREDNPCPDQPYQAALTVQTTNGEKVTQFTTDKDGRFRASLPPGAYVLHPESPGIMPHAADIPFSVKAGEFTRVDVAYDSGIR